MSRHVRKVYRRVELFERVWSAPMRDVARQYGVSDVALREKCKELSVPIPDAGHWNKRPDRRPPRPALPPLAAGAVDEVTIDYWTSGTDLAEPLPAELAALVAHEREPSAAIRVPPTLTDPHPLVANAQRELGRARTGDDGLKVRGETRCLDVSVSAAQLERALCVMDAFAKALEARTLQLAVVDRPEVPRDRYRYRERKDASLPRVATAVEINGKRVYIRVTERLRVERPSAPSPPAHLTGYERDSWQRKHPAPDPRYLPTGELELVAICENQQATWRDGKRWRLEDCLNRVTAQLHVLVHRQLQEDESSRRAEVQRREEERRHYEKQMQRYEDGRRADAIREEIDRWMFARRIRAYVASVHEVIETGGCELVETSELAQTLRWAADYAERIDPIAQLRAQVADRVAEHAAKNHPP
ncbi:MAG: hypothetical protein K8M05_25005 [Deltaproteobacteria bacterium]|nr:hypothetical protein [Kofleriaceae bacterium]